MLTSSSSEEWVGSFPRGTTHAAPRVRVYAPDRARGNGIGLVILPGGGYAMLAEHEGAGFARHFAARGYTCFAVDYRLGSQGFRHPAMLEDGLAALRGAQARAETWGLRPGAIGVMGSSAGGHLAASLLTYNGYGRDSGVEPPAFGILCYPVITLLTRFGHEGSRQNLLGSDAPTELVEATSCERHVTDRTPPCFLWHTWEDPVVPPEHSLLFAQALRRHRVPFELHIFETGRHGLGLDTAHPWADLADAWMRARFSA